MDLCATGLLSRACVLRDCCLDCVLQDCSVGLCARGLLCWDCVLWDCSVGIVCYGTALSGLYATGLQGWDCVLQGKTFTVQLFFNDPEKEGF